jgi:hypothetical protein
VLQCSLTNGSGLIVAFVAFQHPQDLNSCSYKTLDFETRPDVDPRPKPRLFALIVGITEYALNQFNDLPGAVPDAKKIVNWLVADLQVPRNQISLITDKAASRAGIISALKAFGSDDRIHEGDPIFIYYAGHGSSIPPPEDWECGGPGKKIQMLVPQDYAPEHGILGIPDHVLGCLIDRIAEKKGNNIVGSPGIYFHISADLFAS